MQTLIEQVAQGARLDECRAQSALFRLLARTLEYEVDEAFLSHLRNDLLEALAEAGAELPEDMLSGPSDALFEKLAVEYTALFVQPGAISPYASVFETGSMFQEQCDRAARWYQENGFVFKHRYSGEFPDHVGTMLSFVAALFEREAQALEAGEEGNAEEIRQSRERFLIEELGSWAPGWAKLAAQAAQHPFYERMLGLVERVLWDELTQVVPPRRMRELTEKNSRGPTVIKKDPGFRKASGL
ncbi:MAG: molecular chaperone TorD family protein [Alphaproteobacteria bacterium]|nr:molecular chaperone TorD family protein [Alphaproteobacteria bacterium]